MMALTMQAGTNRSAQRALARQQRTELRKQRAEARAQKRRGNAPDDPQQLALKKAKSRVNHRIAFFGHGVVYLATCLLLLVVAGPLPMFIVALSWGIGLAAHGFFAVAAPLMRPSVV